MPAEKTGLKHAGLTRITGIVLLALVGLVVPCSSDDWKVEARGLVTVQTNLTGGEDATRGKFRPGLRAEVLAPLVFGSKNPKAVAQVVAKISILDFPDPTADKAAGPKPAASFAVAIERSVGRAELAGPKPAQLVATSIGVEAGYASFLGGVEAGKWLMGIARLTEERDGLELRVGGGPVQLKQDKYGPGASIGLTIPVRRSGTWVVLGADILATKGSDTVTIFIGGGFK